MSRSYLNHKRTAFWLILLIGAIYSGFLVILTIKVLPPAVQQLAFVWQLIATRCSPEVLLSSTDSYLSLIMAAAVIGLWLKVVTSFGRTFLTIHKTKRYVHKLNPIFRNAGVYEFASEGAGAFTAGLFRPKVYIASRLFKECSEQELKGIIAHEQEHARTRDPLLKLVIDFVRNALPIFPFKTSIFNNYDVLCELSADEYAESVNCSKRSIVSALDKVLSLSDSSLNLAMFGFRNDRIRILVGGEQFKTRQFFSLIMLVGIVLLSNSLLISQTDFFFNCEKVVSQTMGAQFVNGICNSPEKSSEPTTIEVPPASTPGAPMSVHN